MKLYPECGPCMLKRALMFCEGADDETRRKVVRELSRLYSVNFTSEWSTTKMAYERNRLVESITGNKDPMKELKRKSFEVALSLYPKLKEHVEGISDEKKRFIAAQKIALAGNTLEFGARDHEPDLDKLEDDIFRIVEENPAIDESDEVYRRVKECDRILYVTDNAPEVVFDKVFIEELDKYSRVEIAPLSRPVQDDATVEEIKKVGLDDKHRITPRGDSIGVWFEKTGGEFCKSWDDADLVIAKGMGCYETLVDYPKKTGGKVVLLMRVKCLPVSRDIKAPLGSTVVKIM
ncbi:MAG: ARMT1-like domain-containing protein [Candidatus Altiarchaeota archaeon]|nr:ARMT1-like domain-containing protein [Candidatus Altiarchaeota archaeon]